MLFVIYRLTDLVFDVWSVLSLYTVVHGLRHLNGENIVKLSSIVISSFNALDFSIDNLSSNNLTERIFPLKILFPIVIPLMTVSNHFVSLSFMDFILKRQNKARSSLNLILAATASPNRMQSFRSTSLVSVMSSTSSYFFEYPLPSIIIIIGCISRFKEMLYYCFLMDFLPFYIYGHRNERGSTFIS